MEGIPAISGHLTSSTYASPCKDEGRALLLAPWRTNVELSEMILEINNFGMGISGKSTGYVNSGALLPKKSKRAHSPAFAPGLPPRLKQLWRDKTRAGSGDGPSDTPGGAGCPTRPRPLTVQPYVKDQGPFEPTMHYTTLFWFCLLFCKVFGRLLVFISHDYNTKKRKKRIQRENRLQFQF